MPGLRVGVDVGGTKTFGVVLDDQGELLASGRRPTPVGAESILDTIAELALDLVVTDEDPDDPVGRDSWTLGVGIAGIVTRQGVLRASPNLPGVHELDVPAGLRVRLGREVMVDNDATGATFAEWRLGAGAGVSDLVLVTLGTGIGGGMVLGGELQRGHHGFAGEFGHMVVDPAGPPCVCGRRGCWERYASGAGLARFAREAVAAGRAAAVVELAGGDPDRLRGEHVQRAALDGDNDALAIVDELGRWTAVGLVNLTNALDPEVIVIGGGLVEGAGLYLEPIRRWFGELLYAPQHRPHPRIVPAALGERAGALGAALLPPQSSER